MGQLLLTTTMMMTMMTTFLLPLIKKRKKGKTIAKSSVTFDVKPWDDETDLDALRDQIKEIQMDGLVWGTAQKKPLAYGIFKLQIVCVIEDDKVSSDDLVEKIEEFEDHVQSVDIAAFQKNLNSFLRKF